MILHIIPAIKGLLASYGIIGLILGLMIFSILTTFLPLPIDVIVIYAVKMGFDPALIIIAAALGTTLAASIDYFLGYVGSPWVTKKINKETFAKTQAWLEEWGLTAIIFASFVPVPFEIIAITVGVLRMNFYKFFFATLIGKLLKYSISAYVGVYVIHLFGA